jgi:hypothetical protein
MKGGVWPHLPVLASVLLTGAAGHAQPQDCNPTMRKATFVFANGMFTERLEAAESLERLASELSARMPPGLEEEETWSFALAYNASERPLSQILQVGDQRLAASGANFFRILAGLEAMPAWFRDTASELAVEYEGRSFAADGDLDMHVLLYRELLETEQSKVIIVAHSQGNLYANEGYARVSQQLDAELLAAIGVVSVATPADRVAGGAPPFPYVTFDEDLVIRAVRQVFSATLPGNTSSNGYEVDGLSHGFLTAYLHVPSARDLVLELAAAMAGELADPSESSRESPESVAERCMTKPEPEPEPTADPPPCGDDPAAACLFEFFAGCWDAMGACTSSFDAGVQRLRWENGAYLDISIDVSDPSDPVANGTAFGSSGAICARGVTRSDIDDDSCVARTVYTSERGTLEYCIDGTGALRAKCPDGREAVLMEPSMCLPDSGSCM